MNNIKENILFLQAVASLSKKQVKEILRHANKNQINVITEVAKNVLAKNLRLTEPYKVPLKKHRKVIRDIASDTTTYTDRARLIVSKASVVSNLISAVLSRLITLVK